MRTENWGGVGRGRFEASSPRTQHALGLASLYAHVDRPVLLLGRVGTGKTTLARMIHAQSNREGQFVPISSGELTDTLYSDTLFGHVQGAFTGASGPQAGCIERAERGTLLLDDVALMPLSAQAAILRVLDSRRYRPLGAGQDRTASCRFVFASTIPLGDLVRDDVLLLDLSTRIGEFLIEVPALKDRPEEITQLASEAGNAFLRELGVPTGTLTLTEECEALLLRYPWPGNVRELRAVVERALVHAGPTDGEVVLRPGHLPDRFHEDSWDETEVNPPLSRSLVEGVLNEVSGNQSEAARRLGVHRNTIARYRRSAI